MGPGPWCSAGGDAACRALESRGSAPVAAPSRRAGGRPHARGNCRGAAGGVAQCRNGGAAGEVCGIHPVPGLGGAAGTRAH